MHIEDVYRRYLECERVSTDSRNIRNGDLFVALTGPNFNGNRYALEALEKGAKYAVVDDAQLKAEDRLIHTADSLLLLQQLSLHHRNQFSIPFIGITGSNGKTTTKELLHRMLNTTYRVTCTKGNLNNHIGVPLTLLTVDQDTEVAIIEMGANHVGEIGSYCQWVLPTHGLITNIGKAHLEGFGGLKGVLKGKTELYDSLRETGGMAIVNEQHTDLMRRSEGIRRMTYGVSGEADWNASMPAADPFVHFAFGNPGAPTIARSNLAGSFNFENILAASCIAHLFQVPDERIKQAIETYVPSNNRSELIDNGSNAVFLDAYNANPTSMKEAIATLSKIKTDRKVAILGDMLELGDSSFEEHAAIIDLLSQSSIDEVVLVGPEFLKVKNRIECRHFEDVIRLKSWLSDNPIQNSYILVKGSRAIGLEKAFGR